jgi:hypothetical protein
MNSLAALAPLLCCGAPLIIVAVKALRRPDRDRRPDNLRTPQGKVRSLPRNGGKPDDVAARRRAG